MKPYQFSLEKYKGPSSRYICPNCHRPRSFSRYIDLASGEYLDPSVGRCNRESKCGYHMTPNLYFSTHPKVRVTIGRHNTVENNYTPLEPIPQSVMIQSMTDWSANMFYIYLLDLFGEQTANDLCQQYFIGSSNNWRGSTIFWFVDVCNVVRAGQVKLFDDQGHTVKNHTTWVHSIFKNDPNHPWVERYNRNESKASCLFGEHLINHNPTMPIAVVEAPATAIVASVYFPKFHWLATGSLAYLTRARFRNLANRNVVLFPDLGGYNKWKKKAEDLRGLAKIKASDFLERNSTQEEKNQGLDLRDFLTRCSLTEFKQISKYQSISKNLS